MRIYYRTGIELPAGTLRTLIPHHGDHGETSAQDLTFLMHLFGLRPVAVPISPDAVQIRLQHSIATGTPPIVLGRWLSPTTLHWVLGVAASVAGLTVNDPWDGTRRQYPWPLLTSRYAGWCIL